MAECYLGDQKFQLIPSSQFIAFQVSPDTDRDSVMSTVDQTEGIENADLAEKIDPFEIILVPAARGATETTLTSASAQRLTLHQGSTAPCRFTRSQINLYFFNKLEKGNVLQSIF